MAILNTSQADHEVNHVKTDLIDNKIYYINGLLKSILDCDKFTDKQAETLETACNEVISNMRYINEKGGIYSIEKTLEIIEKRKKDYPLLPED